MFEAEDTAWAKDLEVGFSLAPDGNLLFELRQVQSWGEFQGFWSQVWDEHGSSQGQELR